MGSSKVDKLRGKKIKKLNKWRFFLMFQKWADFVREVDPDVITGYNICNFDLPYLLNRARHLKLNNFNYLGRMKDLKSVIKETMIQSKQMGKRENKSINIEGRVQFDLLLVMQHNFISAKLIGKFRK